jgi:phage shock protein E
MEQSTGRPQFAAVTLQFAALFTALFAFQVCTAADDLTAPAPGMSAAATPVPQKLLLSFLADNSTLTLIDARSSEEFQTSHINGAINVPHDTSIDANTGLPSDLQAPVVIYCKTGKRATTLQLKLRELGYTDVQVLQPGQITWFDGMAVFNCGVPASQDSSNVLTSNRAADSGEEMK